MKVVFLTPLAALIGLAVLVPFAAAVWRERRARRLRRALALQPPVRRAHLPFVLSALAFFALIAASGAQPVVRLQDAIVARTDAEAFFLFDVSRSMLASSSPSAPARFDRAVDLGLDLRDALPEVPVGVASTTDRPLSHLFPTVDREAFASVVRRSIGIERPPPFETEDLLATDFQTVEALARDNYFSTSSVRRLVVFFTDGESRPFDARALGESLQRAGLGLIVVRFRKPGERVYGKDGRPEPGYRPDRASDAAVANLALATSGGRVFSEDDLGVITGAARTSLGEGPEVVAGETERAVPLAAYFVLAAGLPLAFLLVRRNVG